MERFSQKILLLNGWRRLLTAFVAGAAASLMLAPFHLFFVAFLTFPILVWLLDGAVGRSHSGRIRRLMPAFWIGWAFGFGYFVAGLWWISNALLVEAPEFAWAVPVAIIGLPAFIAIFYGFATMFARTLWSDGLPRIFVLAAAFGLAEWLRSFVLTGFPWNAIAYGIMPSPVMMQTVAYTGFDAMNVLAVLVFSLPACLVVMGRQRVGSIVLIGLLLSAHLGSGVYRLNFVPEPAPDGRIIRVVQPSIDQSEKARPELAQENFDNLLALTSAEPVGENAVRPQIIVWPETSVPFILTREPGAVAAIADTLQIGQSLVAGVIREEQNGEDQAKGQRYYNSMVVIDSDGVITDAADKTHLVPFGEYLPLKDELSAFGLRAIAAADRGYVSGAQRRSLKLPSGLTVLPLICYEVIFANEVDRLSASDGLIINVTNDAWYGDSPGPYQHLHQTQLRAVELGLPLVRGANSGISAMIDAKGRITHRLDLNQRGAFDAELPGAMSPPFGKMHHSVIFWLIILFFATIGLVSKSRQ